MKTALPSYVPPPYALRLGAALEFERTSSAAMLRGAECGQRALRECSCEPRLLKIENCSGSEGPYRIKHPSSAVFESVLPFVSFVSFVVRTLFRFRRILLPAGRSLGAWGFLCW